MGTNYHNEVLRKARILERQRLARECKPSYGLEDSNTGHHTQQILSDIKSARNQSELDSNQHIRYFTEARGVDRNRQSYDHSRTGPVRDDSQRYMNKEIVTMCGRKPNYMHNKWRP